MFLYRLHVGNNGLGCIGELQLDHIKDTETLLMVIWIISYHKNKAQTDNYLSTK